jgi:hypothetical protein
LNKYFFRLKKSTNNPMETPSHSTINRSSIEIETAIDLLTFKNMSIPITLPSATPSPPGSIDNVPATVPSPIINTL